MRKLLPLIALLLCFSMKALDRIAPKNQEIALSQKLAIDTGTVEKREFRKNYKQEYTSEEFAYVDPKIEQNFWDRFKDWFANWLASIFRLGGPQAVQVVSVLFKIVAVIIIIVVIYLIVKAVLNKEGKWVFGKNSRKIQYQDSIEKNLQAVDFEKLIAQTIAGGNNRLAIRYYYLWLLKRLSEREIIEWDIEKTNSDYLYEIRRPEHKTDFAYLSYLYNHMWYGEFETDSLTFEKARTAFEKMIRSV